MRKTKGTAPERPPASPSTTPVKMSLRPFCWRLTWIALFWSLFGAVVVLAIALHASVEHFKGEARVFPGGGGAPLAWPGGAPDGVMLLPKKVVTGRGKNVWTRTGVAYELDEGGMTARTVTVQEQRYGLGFPVVARIVTAIETTSADAEVSVSGIPFERVKRSKSLFFGGAIWSAEYHIPTTILWPNLLAQALIVSAPLTLLTLPLMYVRRWARSDRGVCRWCAYPIDRSPVCPECGAPTTDGSWLSVLREPTPSK